MKTMKNFLTTILILTYGALSAQVEEPPKNDPFPLYGIDSLRLEYYSINFFHK